MAFYEFDSDDYDQINNELSYKIKKYCPSFDKELESIKKIEVNSNITNKEVTTLIKNTVDNCKRNSLLCKLKLLEVKCRPLITGIPCCDKYKNTNFDDYFKLIDFEGQFNSFIKYSSREIAILKIAYKSILIELRQSLKNNYKNITSIFVMLKSIEALQRELICDFDNFIKYVDKFSKDHNYSEYKISEGINLELLKFYFKKYNSNEKKKVKHLHC